MLLINNFIDEPAEGLPEVFREGKNAAEQSLRDEYQAIREELGTLYSLWESGAIYDAQFAAYERNLLDRMDELEAQGFGASGDESIKLH